MPWLMQEICDRCGLRRFGWECVHCAEQRLLDEIELILGVSTGFTAQAPPADMPNPSREPEAYMRWSMKRGPEYRDRWRSYLLSAEDPARSTIGWILRDVEEELRRGASASP